jgi:hypothetical protein
MFIPPSEVSPSIKVYIRMDLKGPKVTEIRGYTRLACHLHGRISFDPAKQRHSQVFKDFVNLH